MTFSMYYCPKTEAQRGQDTDSGFIPWLFPLLQVPPRKCPAGSSRPSETLAWLCLWEDQSKTQGWAFPTTPPTLLLCKLLGQCGQGPTHPFSDTVSGPAMDTPQQSPRKGVSWQHLYLVPAPPWRTLSCSACAVIPHWQT